MSNIILSKSYSPLSVLNQMDRILDSFFDDSAVQTSACRSPAVNVEQTEKAYLMTVEIPGYSEKDVEIKVDDQLLTVSSRKVEEKSDESLKDAKEDKAAEAKVEVPRSFWLVRERRNLNFARSFTLPKDVDKDNISAKADHGVLTITLPRREKPQPRTIDIQRA